jgi:hypothetical protein
VERGGWGRSCRRYVEGHFEFRTDRVWVAYNDYGHHRRYDRGYRRW